MNCILTFLFALFLSIFSGIIVIPLLKKLKAGQVILGYVKEHADKGGTPTMGGLFFILSAAAAFFVFAGKISRLSLVCMVTGLSFMAVGFLDDYIKIKEQRNLGLKASQKIIFQLSISLIASIFAYKNGLTKFYVPFTKLNVDLGFVTIPVVMFVFIATVNCVNLTDGLDGLAANVSDVYLLFIALLIYFQTISGSGALASTESQNLILLCVCLIGGGEGFLLFNTHKASVFMGDTGSLALGGFISTISIFSGNMFFIPFLGIMFVLSGISVIIQVLHYKRTKKRVFLMAPLHHHFEEKGYAECKIVNAYKLVSVVIGALCLISYM